MTDLELLALAALAAGVRYVAEASKPHPVSGACFGLWLVFDDEPPARRYWNPLTDDGDAMRLAIKLGICIEFGYCTDDAPVVYCGRIEDRHDWPMTANWPDSSAATRRAIVRAAAQITLAA